MVESVQLKIGIETMVNDRSSLLVYKLITVTIICDYSEKEFVPPEAILCSEFNGIVV